MPWRSSLSAWVLLALGFTPAQAADSLREYYCFQYARVAAQKDALGTPDALRAYTADPKDLPLLADGVCLQTVTCAPLNDKAKSAFYGIFSTSAPNPPEKNFEQLTEKARNELFRRDYEAMVQRKREGSKPQPPAPGRAQWRGYIAEWSASSVACLPKRTADSRLVCPSPTDCKNDRHIRLQSMEQVQDNASKAPEGTLVPLGSKKSVKGAR